MNKVKIGTISIIVILLAAGGYSYFSRDNKNLITEVDRKLSVEDQKIYEDRLAAGAQQLADAKTDQEKYDAYTYIGNQKYGLGKLADAKKEYLKAVKYNSENQFGVYTLLYQVEMDMQDYEAARTSITKAIELGRTFAGNWLKYIILEKDRLHADYDTLNGIYQDALNAVSEQGKTDITTSYAQFLEENGKLQEAIDYWKKAILLFPDRKSAYQEEIDRINGKIKAQ